MACGIKKISPEYSSPICTTDKYIKIMCDFAAAAEAEMISKQYGISVCCKKNLSELYLEYSIAKLDELYDPEACLPLATDNGCCWAPCSVTAGVEIVETCLPVTNISTALALVP